MRSVLIGNSAGSLLLRAAAVAGVLTALLSTVWGVGATPDSATEISAARNLQQGHGLRVQSDIHQSQELYATGRFTGAESLAALPLTQYPPMFAILIALPGLGGLDPLDGARWINAGLFGATILLVGLAIRRYGQGSSAAAVCGALLLLASPDMLTIHAMAWSEPAFLFFAVGGLVCTACYLDTARRAWLIAAAADVALASLTRYVGAVLIVAGLLGILLLGRPAWGRRIRDAALFGLVAGLPLVGWFVRNWAVGGSPANREWVFHPVTGAAIAQGLTTVSGWLLPATAPPLPAAIAVVLLVAGGLAASTAHLACTGSEPPGAAGLVRLSILLALFLALYLAFLLFTISFLDAGTPLDGRILSPVFVVLLMLTLLHLQRRLRPIAHAPHFRVLATLLAGAFLGLYLQSSVPLVIRNHNQGLNYTGVAWRQSPLIAILQAAPPGLIYSNGPDAILILTGHAANLIPPKANIYTEKDNVYYLGQIALIREQAQQRPTFLVYFHTINRSYLPQEDELKQELPLTLVSSGSDGSIFVLAGPAAPPRLRRSAGNPPP